MAMGADMAENAPRITHPESEGALCALEMPVTPPR